MPRPAMRSVLAHVPEALAASNVGTWQTGGSLEEYVTDETAAAIFGLDANETATGAPLRSFAHAIHPADRKLFHDRLNRVTLNGGLFVIEYRTMPRLGEIRWVLARGRFERDPVTGAIGGRGIVIDITDSKHHGHVEDQVLFFDQDPSPDSLDRAAESALKARQAIDEIPSREGRELRHSVDALLLRLGRAIAQRTTDSTV